MAKPARWRSRPERARAYASFLAMTNPNPIVLGFNLKSQAVNFKLVEKLRFFGTSDLLRVAIDGKEQYWLRL